MSTAESYPADFVWRPLIEGTFETYAPVLLTTGIYLVLLLAAFATRDHGVVFKTILASGAPWIVNLWGITTVIVIYTTTAGFAHDNTHARVFIRIGCEATVCLLPILGLLIPVNLLCRRIRMPTAFTLSVGGAVAAVYADLIAVLWLVTPW